MTDNQTIVGSELRVTVIEQLDLCLIERLINCLESFKAEAIWIDGQTGIDGPVSEQIQEADELIEQLRDLQNIF
jgi:hypothetical protein